MTHASVTLAEYVTGLRGDALPKAARRRVVQCVLDVLGAAAAGYNAPATRGLREVVCAMYGQGDAAVWFSGKALTAAGAVFCNSAAASALDLDDGNRAARGHPGAAVIPAALACAAEGANSATTADDFMAAVVAGYEVGVRVAAARDAANKTNTVSRQSGRWSGYAAAAAAGRLRRTPPLHLAQAFAIAGVTAPNQEANGSSGYSRLSGNDVKEGIAWSAASGMSALQLAQAGLTGPLDILDHESHFARSLLLDGLGGEALKIRDTYFKPYSCCRYNHPAIDAVAGLMREHAFSASDITAVEVHTFGWALKLGNKIEPRNLVDVQYSIPYCIGVAAVIGTDALLPVDERTLNRPDVSAFARRVTLHTDSALDSRFPAETLARVIVRTPQRVYESPVTTPRGEPTHPMGDEALREKFLTLTRPHMKASRQAALLQAIEQLADGDLQPLLTQLILGN